MEKQLRKKRIRRIALIVTAAVCLAAVLLNLDFEYADYGKALGKEIERAEKVLQEAEPGDQKGQYDEDTIRDFKKQIEKARAVYNDKESEYEQQKKAYEKLKKEIKKFKKSSNKEDIKKDKDKEKKKEDKKQKDKDDEDSRRGTDSKEEKTLDSTEKSDGKITVYIEIRNPTYDGHRSVILSETSYRTDPGKSVYDVLYYTCRNKGIHLDAGYESTYGTTYVKGIDHLYEYDAGSLSGWMYKVNGSFVNYGSSSYKVKSKDRIVWLYTTDGGEDLGKPIP
ncbi:MAG TPA: DUF4430 domain-containing protein [Bacillota bacterium]|nr:DUF4430 domain-containing protein [Bacillota bacterium]